MTTSSAPRGLSSNLVLGVIVLVAMLIGLNFTVLKFALDHTTPLLLAGMRTVIGSSVLIALALARGERFPTRLADLANIFAVGFSITTVSSGLLVFGVDKVPAGVASLLASTMPLFTAALTLLLLGTAISRLGAIGLAVGFAGTVVLAAPSMSGSAATIGILALTASALAWAFGNVYMKWKDFSRVSPIMLVGVQLAMSAMVLIPFALVVEGTGGTDWSTGLLWPLLYAAVPANAVTFALLATVATRATPTQAAASAYLIPVFGVTFGALFRDERPGLIQVAGGVLVVVGVYLVVTSAARLAQRASARTAADAAAS
ncbi:MAG: EamA family transporter [Actinomycetota bacterium]